MKTSRFRLMAAGAVVSGALIEVVNQQAKILEVAADSKYFREAMAALENGDLDRAQRLLIGDFDSLYFEILTRVGAHAALNFKKQMELLILRAINRSYE